MSSRLRTLCLAALLAATASIGSPALQTSSSTMGSSTATASEIQYVPLPDTELCYGACIALCCSVEVVVPTG